MQKKTALQRSFLRNFLFITPTFIYTIYYNYFTIVFLFS